jgi:ABC-2 type transport system permease protein
MSGVAAAELTKIHTLPATWIALAVALIAHTVLGVLASAGAHIDGTVPLGRHGTVMLTPAYVFIAVGVFAAGSEHSAGELRVSLLAVPRRVRLFTAKLAVTAAVSLVGAAVVLLPGHLVQHGPAAAGLAAFVTAYLLLALVGFGVAVLARTVVTPLALLLVAAVLVAPTLRGAFPEVVRYLPHDAALSLIGLPGDPTALDRLDGLSVLTAWAAVSVAAAAAVYTRRDS